MTVIKRGLENLSQKSLPLALTPAEWDKLWWQAYRECLKYNPPKEAFNLAHSFMLENWGTKPPAFGIGPKLLLKLYLRRRNIMNLGNVAKALSAFFAAVGAQLAIAVPTSKQGWIAVVTAGLGAALAIFVKPTETKQ